MSAHRERYLDLCAAFVLGCLDESDRFELDAHLASGCPDCEAELARLGQGAALLAASATPVAPPPAVRIRLLERVNADLATDGAPEFRGARILKGPRPAVKPRSGAWGWATAFAAAAALAIVSYGAWQTGERLRGELKSTQDRMAELQAKLEDERGWATLFDSREARVVALAPTGADSTGLSGRLIYDAASRRAVVILENATVRPGSDYELWAIRGGAPASLGLLRADASGRFAVRLHDAGALAGLQAFAVSVEREGGSPNPNAPGGPVVLVGKVAG